MADQDCNKEDELDRIALEEILKETKRGKERAETMGPIGWVKCPLQPTNKRFFRNVLMGTLANSRRNSKVKKDFSSCSSTNSRKASSEFGNGSQSQDRTERSDRRSGHTGMPETSTCEYGSKLSTGKKSDRNLYSSEQKKDNDRKSMKDPSSAVRLKYAKLGNECKQTKEHKHKIKHNSKHSHRKKRKL